MKKLSYILLLIALLLGVHADGLAENISAKQAFISMPNELFPYFTGINGRSEFYFSTQPMPNNLNGLSSVLDRSLYTLSIQVSSTCRYDIDCSGEHILLTRTYTESGSTIVVTGSYSHSWQLLTQEIGPYSTAPQDETQYSAEQH